MTYKKLSARILSIALSAAMVFTMLPSTVFATEGFKVTKQIRLGDNYDTSCTETTENFGSGHTHDGTATCWNWNRNTNTLSLTDVDIEVNNTVDTAKAAIFFVEVPAKTIVLTGDNKILRSNTDAVEPYHAAISTLGDSGVLIKGTGKLTLETKSSLPVFGFQQGNRIALDPSSVTIDGRVCVYVAKPTITFDARNGVAITGAPIADNGTVTAPTNLEWGDYTFAGWYAGKDGTGKAFTNGSLTASATVYAKWTSGSKTVRTETLDLTGSVTPAPEQGWTWNAGTNTLTIDGLIISTADYFGISLPDGARITASGTNKINFKNSFSATDAVNIMGAGALNINGTGPIDIYNEYATSGGYEGGTEAGAYGIFSMDDLAIDGVTLNVEIQIRKNNEEDHHESTIGVLSDSNVTIGANSPANVKILVGGNIYTATGLQSNDGKITMKAGTLSVASAKEAALDGDVVLEGGVTTLRGASYAYQGGAPKTLTAEGAVITGSEVIGGTLEPAKVAAIGSYGDNTIVLVSDETKIAKYAVIKFNASYTGVEAAAPNKIPAAKTDTSITLAAVTVDDEIVEYANKTTDEAPTSDGDWQTDLGFTGLNANTEYYFFARIKANDSHKVGKASAGTMIKTKFAPTTVSGTVLDAADKATKGAIVTLSPSNPTLTATTNARGEYTINNVPEGVYSLKVTTGTTTITDTVTVTGNAITGKEMKFLDGKKNTVVESAQDTTDISVGGMNDLLSGTNIGKILTTTEKTAVDNGGSVEIKIKADAATSNQITADKAAIEVIASGKTIDKLLDLSVLKTVKDATGTAITINEKITTLAAIIVVQIPIPANLQDKEELAIYRVHNGAAQALPEGSGKANADGEYFEISADGTYVTLNVKNFSTYAFGYTAATPPAPPVGGNGGGSGKVQKPEDKDSKNTFTDVSSSNWFYNAVVTATAKGWFSGTSETTFSPNQPTNRGMIATILHRMNSTPNAAAASFADVAANAYYAKGVAWAQEHDIIAGYGNGTYGPNDNIAREQLASILFRYAGYKKYDVSKTATLSSFTDAAGVSSYANDAMSWAVGSGLISGRGNSTLAPRDTATRAEVATILVKFEEIFTK